MKTVILAAGFGSRLWPLSTSDKPKQFLPLINNQSMLGYTYERMLDAVPTEDIYILILEGMQPHVAEVLPDFDSSKLIVVPKRRNTLPHTLWALKNIADSPDEPVLFKSSDHFIVNEQDFADSLRECLDNYRSQATTILGSKFTSFNTNDGYCVVDSAHKLVGFLEKPTEQAFKVALQNHNVYRSPFIFVTSLSALGESIDRSAASWQTQAQQLIGASSENLEQAFLHMPVVDISGKLFAHAANLQFQEIAYDFVDVGRFEEVYALNKKDDNGNVAIGENIFLEGVCTNNLVLNNTRQPLVVISQKDSVVIQTDNGSLMSSFKDASHVGEVYKKQILG